MAKPAYLHIGLVTLLVVSLVALAIIPSTVSTEGPVGVPVGDHYLGDRIHFSVEQGADIGIRVSDGTNVFRFAGGDAAFTPALATRHDVTVYDRSTGNAVQEFVIDVLPSPIALGRDTYSLGETVAFSFTREDGHAYALSVEGPDASYTPIDGADSAAFAPSVAGEYAIHLDDITLVRSFTRRFTVAAAPADTAALSTSPPATQGPMPTVAGDALARRFPELQISSSPRGAVHDIDVDRGRDAITMRGVRNPSTISRIEFQDRVPGMATSVVTVEGAVIDDATVRLAKTGTVAYIARCDAPLPGGECAAWMPTDLPFIDLGDAVEFTVPHFSSYGGVARNDIFYVTSLSNVATANLSSSRDGTANSNGVTVGTGAAVTVLNASARINGTVIRTTDVINFSANFTLSTGTRTGNATFKALYTDSSGTEVSICQFGDDSTGGVLLTGTSLVVSRTCSPSTNVTIPSNSTLWYVINVYRGTNPTNTFTVYWDGSNPTFMNVSNLQQVDINVSTNQSLYRIGQTVNASGILRWLNQTTFAGNVTVEFINTTGGVMQTQTVNATSGGFYNSTFTFNSSHPVGIWTVNVTGFYNKTINATASTTFQFAPAGNITVQLMNGASRTLIPLNGNFTFMLNVSCSGVAGADCGAINLYPRWNASSGPSIIYSWNTTPWVNQFSTIELWNSSSYYNGSGDVIDASYWNGTVAVLTSTVAPQGNYTLTLYYMNGTVRLQKPLNATGSYNSYAAVAMNQHRIVLGMENETRLRVETYAINGTLLWANTTAPSGSTSDQLIDLAVDQNNNTYATGRCSDCPGGPNEWSAYTFKVAANGTVQWNNSWDIIPNSGMGPLTGMDEGLQVHVLDDGSVFVTVHSAQAVGRLYVRTFYPNGTTRFTLSNISDTGTFNPLSRGGIDHIGDEVFVSGTVHNTTTEYIAVFNITAGTASRNISSVSVEDIHAFSNDGFYQVNSELNSDYLYRYWKNGSLSKAVLLGEENATMNRTVMYARGFTPISALDPNVVIVGELKNESPTGVYLAGLFFTDTPTTLSLSAGQSRLVPFILNGTAAGTYRIDAFANSSVSDVASSTSANATVCVDCGPVIAGLTISPLRAHNGTAVNVSATLTDENGISGGIVTVYYPNGTWWQNLTMQNQGSTYWAAFNASFIPAGNYTVTVRANDTDNWNVTGNGSFLPYINASAQSTATIDGTIADWSYAANFSDEDDATPASFANLTELFSIGAPSERNAPGIVFDPVRNLTLLFGGNREYDPNCDNSGWGTCNGTYAYNHSNNSWFSTSAKSPPKARSDMGMSFDKNRNLTILFGGTVSIYDTGCDGQGAPSLICDGMYFYNSTNSSWYSAGASNLPSARYGASMSWDPVNNRTLLFGGASSGSCDGNAGSICNGTYFYNASGNKWQSLNAINPPSARSSAGFVYDAVLGGMILSGGSGVSPCDGSGTSACNGTYLLNLTNATWSSIPSAGFPASYAHTAVYDVKKNLTLAIGGTLSGDCALNSSMPCIYAFNATTRKWHGVIYDAGIASNGVSVYHPPLNATLIFSGDGGTGNTNNRTFIVNNTLYAKDVMHSDVLDYSFMNNNTHLQARIRINGSDIDSTYRVYVGNGSGNTTTPEGRAMPFAYQGYISYNGTCGVYNRTHYVAACSGANSGSQIELSANLTFLNISINATRNLTVETVTLYSRVDMAPNADSFVQYAVMQDSGPPNAAPTIDAVNFSTPVSPIVGQNRTFLVNFTVTDAYGVGDINDSTATLAVNRGGVTRSGACTPNDQNASSTIYNCSVLLRHYDLPGVWSVRVDVNDTLNQSASNSTAAFTYNPLVAISLSDAALDFGSFAPGSPSAPAADNPIVVSNLGNTNITGLNVTAYSLANDTSVIGAGNMTANATDGVGVVLVNATEIVVPSTNISVSTDGVSYTAPLYFYIAVPEGILAGTYNALLDWVITAYD